MTINKLMMAVLLLLALNTSAQMTPARSDAYQADYAIRTGYGTGYGLLYDADGTTYSGTETELFKRTNVWFQLYNGLKLTANNPTPASIFSSDLKALKISSATAYPYFKSYAADGAGNKIYNWSNWMYPFVLSSPTIYPYVGDPATRDSALMYSPQMADAAGKRGYQDYNKYYYGNSVWFNMSENQITPTLIDIRINQPRDKVIISLWVGYMALDRQRQSPMTDLRLSALPSQTNLYARTWFNFPGSVDEFNSNGGDYEPV